MSAPAPTTPAPVSSLMRNLRQNLPSEGLTLGDLLERLGHQGALVAALVFCLPFLLPVSIPGVSTAFGLVLILIGFGVVLDRVPWVPSRLRRRMIKSDSLSNALERGERLMLRLDKWSRPRLGALTHGATLNRINGLALSFAGVLLVLPLAPIPFSNTLPAAAALLLSLGMLQRDGLVILLGYLAILATLAYFGVLAFGAVAAGRGLGAYFGS